MAGTEKNLIGDGTLKEISIIMPNIIKNNNMYNFDYNLILIVKFRGRRYSKFWKL